MMRTNQLTLTKKAPLFQQIISSVIPKLNIMLKATFQIKFANDELHKEFLSDLIKITTDIQAEKNIIQAFALTPKALIDIITLASQEKYKKYVNTPKHESDPLPTERQREKLCGMAAWAFIEIRALCDKGKLKQATDLADTFHNVLREQYGWGHWTWNSFRSALESYQAKYYHERTSTNRDYTNWLDEIKKMV